MERGRRDPGLQPERTTLSWGRTMLTLLVVSSLALRWVGVDGVPALIPAALSLVAVTAISLTQRRRYAQQSRGMTAADGEAHLLDVLLLGGAVVLVAAGQCLVVALH